MPLMPTNLSFDDGRFTISNVLHRFASLFGGGEGSFFSEHRKFSSEYTVDNVALIDERLRPKAPMPKEDIEILTRVGLSNMGLRNAQLVTGDSHPELYAAWKTLCQRAGYGQKVPQLIVTESSIVNAMEITDNEMVITTGLLKMLDLREVTAVLGHELGHGRRDHTSVRQNAGMVFTVGGALAGNFVGKMGGIDPYGLGNRNAFSWLGAPGRWIDKHFFPQLPDTPTPRPASYLGYLAYIGAGTFLGRIAANQVTVKPTELQADLDGVAISGDPEALASALTKMQAADPRGPMRRFWGYLKSGYPTVEERVDNIHRAASDMPPNPIPVVMAPAPYASPSMQVSGVAQAERLEAPDVHAMIG